MDAETDNQPIQLVRSTVAFAKLRLTDETYHNPRETYGNVIELAENIGMLGLVHPLIVTPAYVVIAGGRRYRAIAWLIETCADAKSLEGRDRSLADTLLLSTTAQRYVEHTPILIVHGSVANIRALALADNVQREQLSSYEVARYLRHLHDDQRMTGVEIARRIGKSPAYVSKKLAALKGAGDTLLEHWKLGKLGDEVVYELAILPFSEQRRRILTDELPKRGAAQRPPIDLVKETLADLVIYRSRPESIGCDSGEVDLVIDALKWVTGKTSSRKFAELLAKVSS